jgi:hypothetical protein
VFQLGLIGVTKMCTIFFALKSTPCSMYSGRKCRWNFGQFTGTLPFLWAVYGFLRVQKGLKHGFLRVFWTNLRSSKLVIAS